MNYDDNGSLLGKNSSQNTRASGNGSYRSNDSFSSVNFYGNNSFTAGCSKQNADSKRNASNGNSESSQYRSQNNTAPSNNDATPVYNGANANQQPISRISYTNYNAYANGNGGNPNMNRSNGTSDNYANAKNRAPQAPNYGGSNANVRSNASQNTRYSDKSASKENSTPQSHTRNRNSTSGKSGSNQKYASNTTGSAALKTRISGGKSGGNGNSSGSGNGKPPKNLLSKLEQTKQKAILWIKRVLRSVYLMGKPMRIFVLSASGFVLICVVLIFAVSGSKTDRTETVMADFTVASPSPTVYATITPEPTPSPTPEVRIEKGAEGEDVMALQKRLMELGYLAIDEPTSYFGNATKEAVKLFQRQHELQQDGICGNETIELLYSDDAKPYVMYEGAEGDDIQSFQEQLVELGYLDENQVTGYYGTDTVSAVTKFQHRNYLTEDGKAGENTLEAINSPDARVSYTKEQEIIAEKKKQAELARAQSAEGRIDKLISIAKKQLGDPYILGKSGPDSFDCSGLVYYCLRQVNVYTRRLNAAGLSKTTSWTKISDIDDVQRGDLLFFKSDDSSTVGHVGIYIGGGEMIDASSANGKVVRRSAKTSYWRRNFVVARRPIE